MARIETVSYAALAFCVLAIVLVPIVIRRVQSVVIAGPKPITVGYSLFPETILFELAEEWGVLSFVGARFVQAPWDTLHQSLLRSNHSNEPAYDIIYSNRKAAMWLGGANYGAKVLQDTRDLVVYKGFAIMYWPANQKLHEYRATSTTMAGLSELQRVSAVLAQLSGVTVFASGDTDHALSLENLIRERGLRNVTVERNGSPNEMLRRFLSQKNSMYVGGASQRIIAEAAGASALIAQDEVDLDLASSNCFTFRADLGPQIERTIDALFLKWRQVAQRLGTDSAARQSYLEKLNQLLSEVAKQANVRAPLVGEEEFRVIWTRWFTVPGIEVAVDAGVSTQLAGNVRQLFARR